MSCMMRGGMVRGYRCAILRSVAVKLHTQGSSAGISACCSWLSAFRYTRYTKHACTHHAYTPACIHTFWLHLPRKSPQQLLYCISMLKLCFLAQPKPSLSRVKVRHL